MSEYTIVKFKANWCGNCNMLSRVMDRVMPDFPQVKVDTVDVDTDKSKAEGVTTIPSLYFYMDGRKVGETKGVPTPDRFRSDLTSLFRIKPVN